VSTFNVSDQNKHLDHKIVSGLERLAQVFRILLWEKAKVHGLSPIQIQLLIFLKYHPESLSTISYLAKEFNMTKPTVSDAVKVLEEKKLIKKFTSGEDTRSYTIQLTAAGNKMVAETEDFADPVRKLIAQSKSFDPSALWQGIYSIIMELNRQGVISVQRTCTSCQHYTTKNKLPYCALLEQKLLPHDIRIDCDEFEEAEVSG